MEILGFDIDQTLLLQTIKIAGNAISLSLMSFGVFLLFQESISKNFSILVKKRRRRMKASRTKDKEEKEESYENVVFRHIRYLLKSTSDRYKDKAEINFLFFMLILFVMTTITVYSATNSFNFSLILGLFVALLPYLYKLFKLLSIRVQAGYDLGPVTGLLLSKYRKNNFNMYEALREILPEISNKAIRRSFRNIVKGTQSFISNDNLEEDVKVFIFLVDTSFAMQLGKAILKALTTRTNVEKSLESLDVQIQKNIQMLHDEKSQNSDIFHLSWVHLIAFPLSIMLLIPITNSISGVFELQFQTSEGRATFTLSLISVLVSVMISLIFRKPKNDI